ncbi:hypothetical protein KAR91_73010 [Candidatus Pacearchaeota archaeon]|nr:hypothetical protein [Candidatus Pacearchaeota archaeon]
MTRKIRIKSEGIRESVWYWHRKEKVFNVVGEANEWFHTYSGSVLKVDCDVMDDDSGVEPKSKYLPEIGSRCEYIGIENEESFEVEIVAHNKCGFLAAYDSGIRCGWASQLCFRPQKTIEERAVSSIHAAPNIEGKGRAYCILDAIKQGIVPGVTFTDDSEEF